jgi:AcrR family transcriptional regulator
MTAMLISLRSLPGRLFLTIKSEMPSATSELMPVAVASQPGKGERTAQRIRDVALDLFSRLGFERVTMAGIAAAAGVSQANLHYHFVDKDQLWLSAMRELSAVIREEARMHDAVSELPPLDRLRHAMRNFIAVSRRHPALGRIVALEGMAGGERLAWLDEHLIGRRNRWLVRVVADAIADGVLKPFPPELVVVTLQTAAVGVINLAPLMRAGFGVDPDTSAARAAHEELIVDALLSGLIVNAQHSQSGQGET